MDYQLIALILIMVATLFIGFKQRLWWGPGGEVPSISESSAQVPSASC